MKRHLAVLTLAAALVAPISTARAANFCANPLGSLEQFCFSSNLNVTDAGFVTLSITNTSGTGIPTLTKVGFLTDSNIFGVTGGTNATSTTGTSTSAFNFSSAAKVNGNNFVEFLAETQGINGGITVGKNITFSFQLSGVTAMNIATVRAGTIYVKAQGLPGSLECSTSGALGGLAGCTSTTTTTSTPEPASLILLGTGMLGVFGAGYRRRKNAA